MLKKKAEPKQVTELKTRRIPVFFNPNGRDLLVYLTSQLIGNDTSTWTVAVNELTSEI